MKSDRTGRFAGLGVAGWAGWDGTSLDLVEVRWMGPRRTGPDKANLAGRDGRA
jgi:hypothetical protein